MSMRMEPDLSQDIPDPTRGRGSVLQSTRHDQLNLLTIAILVGLFFSLAWSFTARSSNEIGQRLSQLFVPGFLLGATVWGTRRFLNEEKEEVAAWVFVLGSTLALFSLIYKGGATGDVAVFGLPLLVIIAGIMLPRWAPWILLGIFSAFTLLISSIQVGRLSIPPLRLWGILVAAASAGVIHSIAGQVFMFAAWYASSYEKYHQWALELHESRETLKKLLQIRDRLNAELQSANEQISRRAMQLALSNEVGQQITSVLDPKDLLPLLVRLIRNRFGYYFVGVWFINSEQNQVELRAYAGPESMDALQDKAITIPLDHPSLVTRTCREAQVRVEDDVTLATDYLALAELPATRSECVFPLQIGDKLFGALDIQSENVAAFRSDDIMVLQTLANQIAIAIRNAELYRSEKRRRQLAEILVETGRTLTSSLDMKEVPQRILEQLSTVVPFARGSIWLQQDSNLAMIASQGYPQDYQAPTMAIREGDVYHRMATTLEPVLISDVASEPGWQQVEDLPLDHSWLGVPLIARDKVIGMISLTRAEVGQFTPDDKTVVQAFAGQAAIALENARLYAEILDFNERLEQMVQERTEALNQANQRLEQLYKSKTKFIEVAAHELRTPLTVIQANTQVLPHMAQIKENHPAYQFLTGIRNGTERLLEIVNSMLDVARIENEALEAARKPVKLAHVISSASKPYITALRERQLTLIQDESLESLPIIHGDFNLLIKVFYQLIGNAIKYTPDGGTIRIVGREVIDHTVPMVEVAVIDTGIGIDPEYLELIFEPAYQIGEVEFHSSGRTKFKGGGPGLGLAIARGIVLAHGGRIWAESPGHDEVNFPGSTFYVRLPIA